MSLFAALSDRARRLIAAVIVAVTVLCTGALVNACGGGGSDSTPAPPPVTSVPSARMDTFFGYFGSSKYIAETADHVNLTWIEAWGDWSSPAGRQQVNDRMARELLDAQAVGIKAAVVSVAHMAYVGDTGAWRYKGKEALQPELMAFLTQLRTLNVLSMVVALYPVDEPDLQGVPAEDAARANADIREVLALFYETRNTKIAVIYGGSWSGFGADVHSTYPGIESYDWVAIDDYFAGAYTFETDKYDHMKARLRPDQRTFLVPSGVDPWRTYPDVFELKAAQDPQVVAIIPFIWWDEWVAGSKGIRSNGMRGAYCRAGVRLTGKPAACPQ